MAEGRSNQPLSLAPRHWPTTKESEELTARSSPKVGGDNSPWPAMHSINRAGELDFSCDWERGTVQHVLLH